MAIDQALLNRAARTRLLVLDVDGVMTDGRLYYDNHGNETKAFHVRDGYGIKAVIRQGCEVAVISGRRSVAVQTRLGELGVQHAILGQDDKLPALQTLAGELGIEDLQTVACVGDDSPDLPILAAVGFAVAPADAHPGVAARVHWQTAARGGRGAVREVCDLLTRAWAEAPS
ncbi:MAG: HAD hydrolase family protein [Chromatiales bacterium]|nr:MAG: HAD hydrolase family protein [Chromatiales bacterium]